MGVGVGRLYDTYGHVSRQPDDMMAKSAKRAKAATTASTAGDGLGIELGLGVSERGMLMGLGGRRWE